MPLQRQFGLQRRLRVGCKTDTVGDAEHVGVDRHNRLVENDSGNDVGSLAAHAWQGLQLVDIIGDLAIKVGQQLFGHSLQMTALAVRIGDRLDIGVDILDRGRRQRLGVGVGCKQSRRDHIDTLVGALGRKHNRYEQLVGIVVMQFALSLGASLFKIGYKSCVSLCCLHFLRSVTITG